MHVSRYERQLIADALGPAATSYLPGAALVLAPDTLEFREICTAAIWPALAASGFHPMPGEAIFDSRSPLHEVVRHLRGAELLVADLSHQNPDVMYVAGLAHGLGRYPLLICQEASTDLPFFLQSIRCIHYASTPRGLWDLRELLTRAVRTFLTAAAAWDMPADEWQ